MNKPHAVQEQHGGASTRFTLLSLFNKSERRQPLVQSGSIKQYTEGFLTEETIELRQYNIDNMIDGRCK